MVSAGDVERYGYCVRNGWLADEGHDPGGDGAKVGIRVHEETQDALRTIRTQARMAQSAWRWTFRLLAGISAAVVATLAIAVFWDDQWGLLMAVFSLVIVAGASGLITLAALADRRIRMARRAANVHSGDIHIGPGGDGPLMEDPATGLRGTPDYILETEQGFVPVELKSGRTPDEPHASHVLQLGCYLQLVQATSGTTPQHGLLTYPKGTFVVAWDEVMRSKVLAAIERIERIRAGTEPNDRDHNEPGRCRGCARRSACDQPLA